MKRKNISSYLNLAAIFTIILVLSLPTPLILGIGLILFLIVVIIICTIIEKYNKKKYQFDDKKMVKYDEIITNLYNKHYDKTYLVKRKYNILNTYFMISLLSSIVISQILFFVPNIYVKIISFIIIICLFKLISYTSNKLRIIEKKYNANLKYLFNKFLTKENINFQYKSSYGLDEKYYKLSEFDSNNNQVDMTALYKWIKNNNLFLISNLNIIDSTSKNKRIKERGIFGYLELEKGLNFQTILVKQRLGTINFDQSLIELEDLNFEKKYSVYTNNKIATLNILTPDILNAIDEIYTKYGVLMELSFKDNHIYIKMNSAKDLLFLPKIGKTRQEKDLMKKCASFLSELDLILTKLTDIIERMGLL